MFEHGLEFVNIDLHCHTISDKPSKFKYDDDRSNIMNFATKYIDKLVENNINICAITNHNLFNYSEYLILKDMASKKKILVLPGVEIETTDGKQGLHIQVIVNPDRVVLSGNGIDTLNHSLSVIYHGAVCEDGFYSRSCKNLDEIIEILDKDFPNDYFIVMSHVSSDKGLFKTSKPAIYSKWIDENIIRKKILAFDKISASDKVAYEQQVNIKRSQGVKVSKNMLIPAFTTSSDPSNLEEVGQNKINILLGELSYGSLYFALSHYELRMKNDGANKCPTIDSLEIKSSSSLGNQIITFNKDLNVLIGIRGSGKSSILELIRYCLDIDPKEDIQYKKDLVEAHLGVSGYVKLNLISCDNIRYSVVKHYNCAPQIFDNEGNELKDLSILNVCPVIYYGQKDLQKTTQNKDLQGLFLDNYISFEVEQIKLNIEAKKKELKQILSTIDETLTNLKKKDTITQKHATLQELVKKYDEYGIPSICKELDDSLSDQVAANSIIENIKSHISSISDFIQNCRAFTSPDNPQPKTKTDIIEKAFNEYCIYISNMNKLIDELENLNETTEQSLQKHIDNIKNIKTENDVKIQKIEAELQIPNISISDYYKKKEELENCKSKLNSFIIYENRLVELAKEKEDCLSAISQLNEDLFKLRLSKAQELNKEPEKVCVTVDYKGNKDKLVQFIKSKVDGRTMKEDRIRHILGYFTDSIDLYNHLTNNIESPIEDISVEEFKYLRDKLLQCEYEFLSVDCEDLIQISYYNKPFNKLSIGQRSTALLLLLMSADNSILIIDQPEDDLDNQTIYDGLISKIYELKRERQFIFATHNPNIPVLGDCERGITCKLTENKIEIVETNIDNYLYQRDIIQIMEGGKDAFNKRNEIYRQWDMGKSI